MVEVWKDIEGYEGKYQVSNLGRVKSLRDSHGKYRELIMTGRNEGHGYLKVSLYKNGKSKGIKIHRLVALAFIPNPDNKHFVDHINGIRNDNRVENLRWVTHKENLNFPLARKNISKAQTNNSKRSKSVLQIDKLTGNTIREFPSASEASRQTGIHCSNITACCRNMLNYTGGYIWKYK